MAFASRTDRARARLERAGVEARRVGLGRCGLREQLREAEPGFDIGRLAHERNAQLHAAVERLSGLVTLAVVDLERCLLSEARSSFRRALSCSVVALGWVPRDSSVATPSPAAIRAAAWLPTSRVSLRQLELGVGELQAVLGPRRGIVAKVVSESPKEG